MSVYWLCKKITAELLTGLILFGACVGLISASVFAETASADQGHANANSNTYFIPGEPIDSDEMRVTVVGSGMPDVRRAQASASILVELGNDDIFLFDVGTGSVMNLNALGVEGKVTKVFLSHLHTDHAGDLDALWVSAISQREEVLTVWGPSGRTPAYGTAAFIENFRKLWYWDKQSRTGILSSVGMMIKGHEFDYSKVGPVYQENGVTITSFPAIHTIDGPVSFRLDWNGLSMVFSGDTKPNKWLVEQAEGVDVLIHESFPPPSLYAEKTGYPLRVAKNIATAVHTPPSSVGKIFAMTKPRLAVVYHLFNNFDINQATIDTIRKSYDGPLIISEDLMVFNVKKAGKIRMRKALVGDKVIGLRKKSIAGKVKTEERVPVSEWLEAGEIKFDDVDTRLK